jgi:hypothetical protein
MRSFTLSACTIALAAGFVAVAQAGTKFELTAISGQGSGQAIVTFNSSNKPYLAATVQVNVKSMLSSRTFTVERRIDTTPDGSCTGAWQAFDKPIRTSKGGAGAQHYTVKRGDPFVSGSKFDIQYRVVGNGTELRSGCITLTVK